MIIYALILALVSPNMYQDIAPMTATVQISVPYPKLMNPKAYGLSTCSAVFISEDTLLTAAHCISDSRGRQWIKTFEGKSYAVKIVKADLKKDLALLKTISPIKHKFARFGQEVQRGDTVYTVNASHGWSRTYTTGIVNNVVIEDETNVTTILHSASIAGGASGSGLFNAKRELIGINVATIRGFSEAVDIIEIRQFIDSRL